jgi:tryptophan-rich sensory protein
VQAPQGARSAAALLVPYLAWVSFAGALNWAVVDLNAPFG